MDKNKHQALHLAGIFAFILHMTDPPPHQPIRSYGRRKGRNLRPNKQMLVDELLPKLLMKEFGTTLQQQDQWWLEIGFGHGEHLDEQAHLHPHIGMIGCEPYINGIGDLLKLLDARRQENHTQRGAENIHLYQGDVRLLMEELPDACLDRAFILFPDPWPKLRHHKRRLINTDFLNALARVMKAGAQLRIATDHADYLSWILAHMLASKAFSWHIEKPGDALQPYEHWVETTYQKKAIREGRQQVFLRFVRI